MNKKTKLIIVLLLAILAMTSLALFLFLAPDTTPDATETQGNVSVPLTSSQQYTQAVNNIKSNFTVTVTCEATLPVTQTCISTVYVSDYGTENMQIVSDSSIKIGLQNIDYQSAFQRNHSYLDVADSAFGGEMSAEDFYLQFSPVPIFSTKLYSVISSQNSSDGLTIYFSQPSQGEPWAMPSNAILESAQGTAVLKNGELVQSTYAITYKLGDSTHEKQYRADFSTNTQGVMMPDIGMYTMVSAPQAALQLEYAYGYIMATTDISSYVNDQTICETFGDELYKTTALTTSGTIENYSATLKINIQQKNKSRGDDITQKHQAVTYENGTYTMIIDNGDPITKTTITPGYMQSYCKDYLVGTILMPSEISDISIEESENQYVYRFISTSDALAERIRQRASQDLYGDAVQLENLYTTDSLGGYLTIDKHSGLPVASGINYTGAHEFDGNPYKLIFKTDQTYN